MPWPPKIAHAKPHERPHPFDAWCFGHRSPIMEKIIRVSQENPVTMKQVADLMKEAFEAGVEYSKHTK